MFMEAMLYAFRAIGAPSLWASLCLLTRAMPEATAPATTDPPSDVSALSMSLFCLDKDWRADATNASSGRLRAWLYGLGGSTKFDAL